MVDELRSTTSTNDKIDIIKNHVKKDTSNFIKEILLYTYHPLWQYGVTSDNILKNKNITGSKYDNFFDLLNDLRDRKITGHNAIGAVNTFIDNNENYKDLILCVIDKDLKTRTGDKIINKAIPNHIPEFGVALAENFKGGIKWAEGWYVSRKIDGCRCIAIVDNNGNTAFYSRSGKSFDTLDVIGEKINSLRIKNVVFDGELCLLDKDGNEDFQGIMKEIRKKNHTIQNPSYKIFDCLTHEEFYSKSSDRKLEERFANACELLDNENSCINFLEHYFVENDEDLEFYRKRADIQNWEGLILRKNTTYKGKRSKDLLKLKTFFDDEYVIHDAEMSEFRYIKDGVEIEEIMLSAVMISHKNNIVRVGSGFTIEQRQHYFKNPEEIIGSVATIQYFEETKNQEGGISLRFPTIKIIHGKERKL